jgi:hypothetical protein
MVPPTKPPSEPPAPTPGTHVPAWELRALQPCIPSANGRGESAPATLKHNRHAGLRGSSDPSELGNGLAVQLEHDAEPTTSRGQGEGYRRSDGPQSRTLIPHGKALQSRG